MPLAQRFVALACAICLALPACSAHQRAAAGGTVALIGGATTVAGVCIATGYVPHDTDDAGAPHAWSAPATPTASPDDDDFEANPTVGIPTFFVGLALTVVGGILFGTSARAPDSNAPPTIAPSVPNGPSPAPTF